MRATPWVDAGGGVLVRRTINRRDFARLTAGVAGAAALPVSLYGCGDDESDWSWLLDVAKLVIQLIETAVGSYETRNTGSAQTNVEVTTSALNASGEEVDRVRQVMTVPGDGETYRFQTPSSAEDGLIMPMAGMYQLRGEIPAADAVIQSRMFEAVG